MMNGYNDITKIGHARDVSRNIRAMTDYVCFITKMTKSYREML